MNWLLMDAAASFAAVSAVAQSRWGAGPSGDGTEGIGAAVSGGVLLGVYLGCPMSQLSFFLYCGLSVRFFCVNKRHLWLSHTFPALKPLLRQSCGGVFYVIPSIPHTGSSS